MNDDTKGTDGKSVGSNDLLGDSALKHGADFARQLIPIIKTIEPKAQRECAIWWGGFLGAIVGCAGASIGPDATAVLGEALRPMIEQLVRDKAH